MDVLIIDDHPLMQQILPEVLRAAFGDVNVAAVGDLDSAFQRLAHHKPPDLALLDLQLPGHQGIDTLRRFRWKFPDVPVVVVSSTDDAKSVRVALEQGAVGYLPKSLTADVMVAALKRIAAGETYVPPEKKP
jgi:DNA-binding NarL/FixJ family response regulator